MGETGKRGKEKRRKRIEGEGERGEGDEKRFKQETV
jgi:hypothetical protein